MTLEEFIKKYIGKSIGYPEGKFVGECLSSVKWYIKEVFGINPPPSGSNSAYGYWSNFPLPLGEIFEKINNTPDNVPQRGDIVIWKPWSTNPYGHIAIFESGDLNGFKSWDQNWDGKELHLQSHDYKNVIGWLRPIKNSESNMTEEQKRILQFLEEQKANEGKVREAFGALNDLPTIQNKLGDLELKLKDLETKYSELDQNYIQKVKDETRWQRSIDTANQKISEQEIKIEELDTLAKKNWTLYDNKRLEFKELQETLKQKIEEGVKEAYSKYPIRKLLSIIINRLFKR